MKRLLLPALLLLALGACEPDELSKYEDPAQGDLTSLQDLVLDDDFRLTSHVDDWRDEIIYQVLVDRFADGDFSNNFNVNKNAMAQFHGGDWQGLIDHVWYLKELGVTAIWISPVVNNVENDAGFAGYHGYWTQNFLKTNPHFGDLAKLRELVDVMHANDIKVIMDIVTNHIGQLFFYDINGNGWPDEAVYGCGNSNDCSSQVQHVIEYDPDFDERGIQGKTSLGESGPAPIIWIHDPVWNHMPILPKEFQNPDWYNKKGRVWVWRDWVGDAPELHTTRLQEETGDFPGGLKDMNTTHPDAIDGLIKVFKYWIRTTDIDGYRIDTLKHVEHSFWERFCPEMRNYAKAHGKDKFFQFGEAFDGDDWLIGSYTSPTEIKYTNDGKLLPKDGKPYREVDCETLEGDKACENAPWIDSVFYFSHKFQVFDAVFKWGEGTSMIERLYNARAENYGDKATVNGSGLPPQHALVNFISNHDIERFLYHKPSREALQSAFAYLLTMDGIPCIYYGEEQEFTGGNDPANREDMIFDLTNPTFQMTRNLIALRARYQALRRGDFTIRWSSDRRQNEPDAGIIAFERTCGASEWSLDCSGETVLVVVNASDYHPSRTKYQDSVMTVGFPAGTKLVDVGPFATAEDAFTVSTDQTLDVEVPIRGFRILVPEGADH